MNTVWVKETASNGWVRMSVTMIASPPPPPVDSEESKVWRRAVAFGQPQIMGGMGQWDNARYMPRDTE